MGRGRESSIQWGWWSKTLPSIFAVSSPPFSPWTCPSVSLRRHIVGKEAYTEVRGLKFPFPAEEVS